MAKSKKKSVAEDSPMKRKTRSAPAEEPVSEAADAASSLIKKKKKNMVFHPKSYGSFILKMAKARGLSLKGEVVSELDACTHFLVDLLISRSKRIVATRKIKVETIKPAAVAAAIHTLLPASEYKNALLESAESAVEATVATEVN